MTDMSELQTGIDDVLGIDRNIKPKNYFVTHKITPIGTKKPFDSYDDPENIPEEEIVYDKIDKTNVVNSLTVAPTGAQKTRLRKRITGYFHLHGYKILVFEPKSFEFLMGSIKKGTGRRLHKFEENGKMKVKAFCPSYVKKHIYTSDTITKHFNFYSPKIKSFTDPILWRNLGISGKCAAFVVSQILNKNYSLDKILNAIQYNKNLMSNSKKAAEGSISILQDLGFFDRDYKEINLAKEWKKGNIVATSYFSQQGMLMRTDIAKLIQQVRDIGNYELQHKLLITPKFIDFDDSIFYAIRERDDDFNLCIREIMNAQNNYRSLGINTNITVQNPNFILPEIIDSCTTKYIAGIENPESLRGLIPAGAFNLLNKRDLMEDESTYTHEWIVVRGRRKWETFFPFDVPYGHGK